MLKKQLCMIIICCCLVQPSHTSAAEKNTYNPDIKDSVTLADELPEMSLKSIENSNVDAIKTIDDIDSDDDAARERDFIESCPHLEPSKTEKFAALVAPYIIPAIPYVLPPYLYMAACVESMKLRAVRCYRAIAKRNTPQPDSHKKG